MKIPALLLSACIGLSLTACATHTVKPSPAEQFLQPTTIEGQYRSLDSLIAGAVSNGVLRRAPLPVTLVK